MFPMFPRRRQVVKVKKGMHPYVLGVEFWDEPRRPDWRIEIARILPGTHGFYRCDPGGSFTRQHVLLLATPDFQIKKPAR